MMFRREDRDRVARGEITLTFRLWKTPKVKAGKRYATGFGTVEVDAVDVIPAALVRKADVRRTGCDSREKVWQLAGEHTKSHVGPDTLLYRVQFRFLGNVPTSAARTPETDLGQLAERLARMDRLSSHGEWTLAFLHLIDANPHVPARTLAAEAGWERLDFKAHVRKLKALGLTISHETGYELSELGRRYVAHVGT